MRGAGSGTGQFKSLGPYGSEAFACQICAKKDPGRLSEVFGASGPVSRVLSFKTAIYLDAPSPVRSSRLPGTAGPACMSLHGVAPDRVYSDGRLARRRVSSYLTFPPSPARGRQSISVALFLGSPPAGVTRQRPAVYFCCTFPRVAPGGCYPLSLPCGARTFLTPGPFAPDARLSSPLASSIIPEKRSDVK